MEQGTYRPRGAATEYRDRSPYRSRPDRVAFWALMLAVVAMLAGAVSARAGTGGLGSGTSSGSRYDRLWKQEVRDHEKRWARRTSDCESGGDAKAVSSRGTYRGAFQFTLRTWRHAPKSPGGDPINYPWRTQAVVAVYLKRHDGTGTWPRCG